MNKREILIDDSALNQYVGIGYEISNDDTTINVRPDFQTLQVNHKLFSNVPRFSCEGIRKVKFRYFIHEEEFLNDWERMGFPAVFFIYKLSLIIISYEMRMLEKLADVYHCKTDIRERYSTARSLKKRLSLNLILEGESYRCLS